MDQSFCSLHVTELKLTHPFRASLWVRHSAEASTHLC